MSIMITYEILEISIDFNDKTQVCKKTEYNENRNRITLIVVRKTNSEKAMRELALLYPHFYTFVFYVHVLINKRTINM